MRHIRVMLENYEERLDVKYLIRQKYELTFYIQKVY